MLAASFPQYLQTTAMFYLKVAVFNQLWFLSIKNSPAMTNFQYLLINYSSKHLGHVDAILLDWIGHHLYWLEMKHQSYNSMKAKYQYLLGGI